MLAIINTDKKLLETVVSLKTSSSQYSAIQFYCHRLNKGGYSDRLHIMGLSNHFKDMEGFIYMWNDCDIIVLLKNCDAAGVSSFINKMASIIADTLAQRKIYDLVVSDDFTHSFAMPEQWQDLFIICKKKINHSARHQNKMRLTPTLLADIENTMHNIDLTHFLRNQSICNISDKKVAPVFDEVYVNIEHLKKLLMHDVDFVGHKALFRCLTELLDTHVLGLLNLRPVLLPKNTPFSLNLNIETILSDKFLEFDQIIKNKLWVAFVVEINISDIFNDMYAYIEARDRVRSLGYRICIDGLSSMSMDNISRKTLDFDLIKLQWNHDVKENIDSEENVHLAKAIEQCGSRRIILCRCDDKSAIDYGKALGISLFQGRHIDSMLNPTARIVN